MDRLFLDANVLFSAAYEESAGIARLWSIPDIALCSSAYAVEEARRNLETAEQRTRLDQLLLKVDVVSASPLPTSLLQQTDLPQKDWPIVGGALSARATHLITGDRKHFGKYFGQRIGELLVLPPSEYLRLKTAP